MSTAIRPASLGWSLGLDASSTDEVFDAINRGFSAHSLTTFRKALEIGSDEVARLLHTSTRTLQRRTEQGTLSREESDQLYRIARLYERATEVLGDGMHARRWMKKKAWALGNRTPLAYASNEAGAREVERLLGRIEYGVYS